MIRNRTRLGRGALAPLGLAAVIGVAGLALAGLGGAKAEALPKAASASSGYAPNPTQTLRFIENRGQWDGRAEFAVRTPGISTWVTENGLVFDFFKLRDITMPQPNPFKAKFTPRRVLQSGHVVELKFEGNTTAAVVGVDEKATKLHYYSQGASMTSVSVYGEALMRNLYPGVDARVYVDGQKPRYDLIVRPGGNPQQIRMRFDGADSVSTPNGTTLRLGTSIGDMDLTGLYAYQETANGHERVSATFVKATDGTVRFKVGPYDSTRPLIIDPVVYSSLLGGAASNDVGTSVVVSDSVQAYVCGYATGTTFPTTNGAYNETPAPIDGFITKFLPDGSDVEFSTLIGGTGDDFVWDLARDTQGNIYATGDTAAAGLGTAGAFQVNPTPAFAPACRPRNEPPVTPPNPQWQEDLLTWDDNNDAFVIKLAPAGNSVVYFTYIGGNRFDSGRSIGVDGNGNAVVLGITQSGRFSYAPSPLQQYIDLAGPFFPLVNARQTNFNGSANNQDGDGDCFLLKVNPTGTGLVFSTYVGGPDGINPADAYAQPPTAGVCPPILFQPGVATYYQWNDNPWDSPATHNDDDQPAALAVGLDGSIYCAMESSGASAWITAGSYDTTPNGVDCLVFKLSPDGQTLEYGTYVGGNDTDSPTAIDVDANDNAYITGTTTSFNFPRTFGAYDRFYNNGLDCFVTKINRLGTALVYSTFLGTTGAATPLSIDVDDLGFANLAGAVGGQTLPVTANADDTTWNGPPLGFDAYIQVLNNNGTALQYCSYWGGSSTDVAFAIAVDGARNAYITGYTFSDIGDQIPFPTTPDAFKTALVTEIPTQTCDAYISKIKTRIPTVVQSLVLNPTAVVAGEQSTGTVTLSAPASVGGMSVSITNNNNSVVAHPGSIFIAEGATTGTFTINTTSVLANPTTVRITAFTEGDSKFADLSISPWLVAFTLSNDTVVGGNLITGRVNLFKLAPQGGITISLLSGNTSVVTVPQTVSVPEGQITASFDVNSVGVSAPVDVDISASHNGVIKTVTLTVLPASLLSIGFTPSVVSGGNPTVGTVTLDGFAPAGGFAVNLSSNNAALTIPGSVTVLQNTRSVSFNGTTTSVPSNTSVTVTATAGAISVQTFVDILRLNLISLTLVPSTVQGGNTSVGTVGLDFPAIGGAITISLTSSAPGVASVPATVTIPSGSTIATFNIPTVIVTSLQNVTISATLGATTIQQTLTVTPITFNVNVTQTSIVGGQVADGTVTLTQPAPTGGVSINLASDHPNATVPVSVTIGQGNTTAAFTVLTTPVAVTATVTITASYQTSNANDTFVLRAPRVITLTLSPSSVAGGSNSTGTITLDGNAPTGGVDVNVTSNNAAATVPATVTVLAGTKVRTFTITTIAVTSQTVAQITATVNGGTANANLTILAANLLRITFAPSRVHGGQNTVLTIELDANAPPGGAIITLTSSNPELATIPASVTIPAGQRTRTLLIPTRRVSRTLVAQVTGTYGSQSKVTQLTVIR